VEGLHDLPEPPAVEAERLPQPGDLVGELGATWTCGGAHRAYIRTHVLAATVLGRPRPGSGAGGSRPSG
jgi:hypothetical protein